MSRTIAPAKGKLGILIPGMGAVSTTFMAGIEAVKKGIAERAIQAELKNAARGKTALVIAHRLSTVVDAHEIVVLDRGRVVERGAHDELLARDGRYAEMWRLQRSGADAGAATA